MPKMYERRCDYCKCEYRGRGSRFCSRKCHLEQQAPTTDYELESIRNTASGQVVYTKGSKGRIITYKDLLDAVDFDPDLFDVVKGTHNKWEVAYKNSDDVLVVEPLFKAEIVFKPIAETVDAKAVIDNFIQRAHDYAPTYEAALLAPERPTRTDERYMYEINLTDHHVGKLNWGIETLSSNRDTDIAIDEFLWAVDELIKEVEHKNIDRILFPLGNDLFHSDRPAQGGGGGITTRGTIVDVDTRRKKLITSVEKMCIQAIDYMLTKAHVDIVMVPGNHDEDTAFTLGEYLTAWYRNCDNITIDNSPSLRKYYKYGQVLLGFTHGNNETIGRLPMLMPLERPDLWGQTSFREWHVGDKHHKNKRDVISVDEKTGMRIRIFPSLAGSDAWHAAKGFSSGRAAEALLWGHDTGFRALNSVNLG